MKKYLFIILLLLWSGIALSASQSQKVNHDCILTVEIADRPEGAEHRYWCHGNGPTRRIKIPANFVHGKFKTGDKVKVQGRDSIEQGQPIMEIDGVTDITPQAIIPADTQFTLIDNKTLVMNVSYSDVASSYTLQQVKDNFAQVVNPFFIAQSYGHMKLVGLHTPTAPADFADVKIDLASGGCDIFTTTSQAFQAAQTQGFGTGADQYNRFVYIIPNSPCGFSGVATVGWSGGYAVSNGDLSISCRVICHELGHNLGLYHATCSGGEYCDYSDMMGNTSGVYGGSKRDQLGWVNTNGMPTIPLVTQAGDYTIKSLEIGGIGQNGIKFIDPLKANTNFYVTYHAGDGWSTGKPVGVYVHESASDHASTSLIRDRFAVGETFQADAYTQLYVTVKSMTATQAVVGLSFSSPRIPNQVMGLIVSNGIIPKPPNQVIGLKIGNSAKIPNQVTGVTAK